MRVDIYLNQMGHARSRSHAAQMIAEGAVSLDGKVIKKAGDMVDESVPHQVLICDRLPFVGRGGLKLERALDEFHIDCTGVVALDIGASTGGFTDCMLQRGAAHVFAVDAGVGQLSPSLRTDARVTNIENCNARYLNREALGPAFPTDGVAFAVMDVSFISQTLIYPALVSLLSREANVVTLIKPQFEAGRGKVGKGGIVRSAQAQRDAVLKVLESAAALSLSPVALIPSPIRGGDGNTEYLLQLKCADHPVGAAFEDLLRGVGLS